MKKLQQLHQEIIKHINSENIFSWTEDIKTDFQADSLDDGFVIQYQANYLLSSISQNNDVIAKVVFFLAQYDQYDAKPNFNTDVANDKKIDLLITVDFQEQANLVLNDKGSWQVGDKKYDLVYEGFREDIETNDFVSVDYVE